MCGDCSHEKCPESLCQTDVEPILPRQAAGGRGWTKLISAPPRLAPRGRCSPRLALGLLSLGPASGHGSCLAGEGGKAASQACCHHCAQVRGGWAAGQARASTQVLALWAPDGYAFLTESSLNLNSVTLLIYVYLLIPPCYLKAPGIYLHRHLCVSSQCLMCL